MPDIDGIPPDPSDHVCQLIGVSPCVGFCSPKTIPPDKELRVVVVEVEIVVELLVVVEDVEVEVLVDWEVEVEVDWVIEV